MVSSFRRLHVLGSCLKPSSGIIIEQSLEWQSPLYLNFIDFCKAFDSVDLPSMWKIVQPYGVPMKETEVPQNIYSSNRCQVIHNNCLFPVFDVKG